MGELKLFKDNIQDLPEIDDRPTSFSQDQH